MKALLRLFACISLSAAFGNSTERSALTKIDSTFSFYGGDAVRIKISGEPTNDQNESALKLKAIDISINGKPVDKKAFDEIKGKVDVNLKTLDLSRENDGDTPQDEHLIYTITMDSGVGAYTDLIPQFKWDDRKQLLIRFDASGVISAYESYKIDTKIYPSGKPEQDAAANP